MQRYQAILLLILAMGAMFVSFALYRQAHAPGDVACTLEAKLCPDGSAVGRTGPNCEFALCPVATTTPPSIAPYNSGVEGAVLLGPTCPVLRDPPDPACADKPYATAILVYRTGSSAPYVIGNSNEEGKFRFKLPPGSYTLSAKSEGILPFCAETTVSVVPDEFTEVTISCDTGIR